MAKERLKIFKKVITPKTFVFQLDENVPLENLEKSLNYFQQIYLLHLAGEKIDHGKLLNNHLKVKFWKKIKGLNVQTPSSC